MLATVTAMVAAGSAVSAVGVQSYLDSRHAAQAALVQLTDNVAAADTSAAEVSAEAASLVAAAQTALTEADGKTLDAVAQDAVRAAISALESTVPEIQAEADAIAEQAAGAQADFDALLLWPPNASERVDSVQSELDLTLWETAKESLNLALKQLEAARAAWQAEQDRIAAEQAAAAAAAAAARAAAKAASSSISSSGGSSAENAPTLSTENATTSSTSAESYLAALVSGISVVWDSSLCQVNTICGTTTLSTSAAPVITLDTDLRDYYVGTNAGTYVLVHEAAHARSWYHYGSTSALIAESVAATGNTLNGGRAAVEYMADCATIYKIGLILPSYTYTSSCTPAQLAEAATYW